ncbi:MAG: phosphoadenylyl-sulfate reductase [Planctomycetes bacterium]|nr:phosphoadenylyl-sulfate reductase [Planctomycetota bacterium]
MGEEAAVDALNRDLDGKTPLEIIQWAARRFAPRLFATTAFGRGGMALLHMLRQAAPETPVLFIDTGYHFPETLEFLARIEREMGVRFTVLRPAMPRPAFLFAFGDDCHQRDPDRCCAINKVEPLDTWLSTSGARAWLTAIRADQGGARASTRLVEDQGNGLLKIAPLARWTLEEVNEYVTLHGVPTHPLNDRGYPSVGCQPCTTMAAGEREGRWAGAGKTECGIHTFLPRK